MYLFCCESKESSDCFHLSCSEVCSFNIISLSWLTVGLWDGGSYFEKYGALTDAYMPKAIARFLSFSFNVCVFKSSKSLHYVLTISCHWSWKVKPDVCRLYFLDCRI